MPDIYTNARADRCTFHLATCMPLYGEARIVRTHASSRCIIDGPDLRIIIRILIRAEVTLSYVSVRGYFPRDLSASATSIGLQVAGILFHGKSRLPFSSLDAINRR